MTEHVTISKELLRKIIEYMPSDIWKRREFKEELQELFDKPTQAPDAVFYRCLGCMHEYQDIAPSSCDCCSTDGFERVEYYTNQPK